MIFLTMLYLVRKLKESIIINNDIKIEVVALSNKSVKLGITFPKTATVLREEIHARIEQENKDALKLLKEDRESEETIEQEESRENIV